MIAAKEVIAITKVRRPYGWMSNMSPHRIVHQGRVYRTAEALFQCLRFDDEAVRQRICEESSPMAAKQVAKSHAAQMIIEQRGEQDVENMRLVLKLKIEQHPDMRRMLLETGDAHIVEDCTRRRSESGLFWGAAFNGGQWAGKNQLGELWMELRERIRRGEG